MGFVFYDTETTGISTSFDQILQFAAILTDDDLNELDRFEIRCRILPWVVPVSQAGMLPVQIEVKLDFVQISPLVENQNLSMPVVGCVNVREVDC